MLGMVSVGGRCVMEEQPHGTPFEGHSHCQSLQVNKWQMKAYHKTKKEGRTNKTSQIEMARRIL